MIIIIIFNKNSFYTNFNSPPITYSAFGNINGERTFKRYCLPISRAQSVRRYVFTFFYRSPPDVKKKTPKTCGFTRVADGRVSVACVSMYV